MKFRVARKEIEIKAGDYLYNNLSCIMFHAGDKRKLFSSRKTCHDRNEYIMLPNNIFKGTDKIFASIRPKDWEVVTIPLGKLFNNGTKDHYKFIITQEWLDLHKKHIEYCFQGIKTL